MVSFFLKSSGFGECREYRGPKIPILLFRAESNQNLKGTAVVVVVEWGGIRRTRFLLCCAFFHSTIRKDNISDGVVVRRTRPLANTAISPSVPLLSESKEMEQRPSI